MVRLRVYRSSAAGGVPTNKVRVLRSEGVGAVPSAPRMRVLRSSGDGPLAMSLRPLTNLTGVEPSVPVTITAMPAAGSATPTSYAWRQVSGTPVVVAGNTASITILGPAGMDGASAVLGVRGVIGSAQSAEQTVTVTALPQIHWTAGPAGWVPVGPPQPLTGSTTPPTGGTPPAQLTVNAGTFQANGTTLRLAGANFYDAITSDAGGSPGNLEATPGTVRRATLDQLVATGHNAIRAHTLFIGYGKPGTQMPTNGVYDEAVLVRCDEFLAECRARGLYVMAPLTDSWDFYHGGAITFANMVLGGSRTQDQARTEFCTNPAVITAYRSYVTTLMNRVNTVTGVRWRDDPTLAIIETANEAWQAAFMAGSPNYHAQTAAWLRGNWPNKLVADGFACSGSGAVVPAHSLGNPNFQIVGTHFYDDMRNNTTFLNAQAARAVAAGQAFVLGEWDWRDVQGNGPTIQNTTVTRQQFLTAMDGNPQVSGSFWWAPRVTGRNHNGAYQLYLDTPVGTDQTSAKTQLAAFNATFKS